MGTTLRDFAPQIFALLGGGLISSLGLTYAARGTRAQAVLARLKGLTFAVGCVVLAALGGGGAYLLVRATLAGEGPQLDAITPGALLLFGLMIGIPLALPGLVVAWSDARASEKKRVRRRDFVPTKDDRRKFAEDLVKQIHDVSPTPREVRVTVGGDGDRILILEGDIEAKEGERLTAALRADLSELGFKRVEGKTGGKEWWSRV